MDARKWGCLAAVTGMTLALGTTSPALGAAGDGGGGGADTGSLYSDLVVALRAADGTPILEEYFVDSDDDGTPDTYEYCVQPVSYTRVPGVAMTVSPLDGRDIWVIPLQGEWLGSTDPLPVEEIEACDPQPQYAMFVTEAELERLNLTRTSESVIAKKTNDVRIKLSTADEITLDAAGRIATDGLSLDAAPEYAAMYESLMTTGTIPGLPASMAGPPAGIPAGSAGSFDAYELAAVAVGTAASKTVPITRRHRAVLQPHRRLRDGRPAAELGRDVPVHLLGRPRPGHADAQLAGCLLPRSSSTTARSPTTARRPTSAASPGSTWRSSSGR